AVGKTTLAKYLHKQLRDSGVLALYIPLQGKVIGDNFFFGLLSAIFPSVSRKDLVDALFSGSLIVIFDGYDEIAMTSTQLDLNRKFVEEIISGCQEFMARGGIAKPCIVFLFRSVFYELRIFDAIEDSSKHYRVGFFDRSQQKDFLSKYLIHMG